MYLKKKQNVLKEETKMYIKKKQRMYLKKKQKCT